MILYDGSVMHERQGDGPVWSPAQLAAEDQCVNFGANECTGRAEENGWCSGCWALIVPPA